MAARTRSPGVMANVIQRYGDVQAIGNYSLGAYRARLAEADRESYYSGMVRFISNYAASEAPKYPVARVEWSNQSMRAPNGGIAVGSPPETFTFNLTGTNLNLLSAGSFANELNGAGYYFAARFKGMSGSGSDKVPAGADASGGGHISSTNPEPASVIPWAAFGLGLLVYAARKGRQTRTAVHSA